MTTPTDHPSDFIRDIVADDLRAGKYKQICTRFPPEPNGYLHIGHAKSICLNFGIAREFGGICNIRMDDTNPIKEEAEYVESIMTDVRWLVAGWAGEHVGGAPFYASDYVEGITHSVCTLEFEVHRPLYDWILSALELPEPRPHQYEFARLNLTYSVMSKRKLIQLVNEKLVNGWDDPRMLTISGLRRRGVTASALRAFAYNVGITKYPSTTDMAVLEHTMRDEFNRNAARRLAVLRPIKIVLTNYPEGKIEELDAINNPEDPKAGMRKVPFSRELYIESDDFMETPPPKYFRLRPGGEVRLKYAYIIKCDEVVKDDAGKVIELRCTVDLDSKSGGPTAARKIKGTIHWVSAAQAIDAEVRLYDRLFSVPEPDASGDFKSLINPNSLEVVTAKCEPALATAHPEERYQFERLGYFALDPDSTREKQVWNRTTTLRDTWAKVK